MSLKHKNTSKWSKQQAIYAKYSDRAREQVQEQLEISKQLTQRVKEFEVADSEDENIQSNNTEEAAINNALNKNGLLVNNPWMKMMSGVGESKEQADNSAAQTEGGDYSRPGAFVDHNELKTAQQKMNDLADDDDSEFGDDLIDKSELTDVVNILKDDEDEEDEKKPADVSISKVKLPVQFESNKQPKKKQKLESKEKQVEKIEKLTEPVKENNIKLPKVATELDKPKTETAESKKAVINNREKGLQHNLTISEAFADDDVIEEFRAEKVNLSITKFEINYFYFYFQTIESNN